MNSQENPTTRAAGDSRGRSRLSADVRPVRRDQQSGKAKRPVKAAFLFVACSVVTRYSARQDTKIARPLVWQFAMGSSSRSVRWEGSPGLA